MSYNDVVRLVLRIIGNSRRITSLTEVTSLGEQDLFIVYSQVLKKGVKIQATNALVPQDLIVRRNAVIDFPRPGSINKIYIATSTDAVYYWDEYVGDYVLITGGNDALINDAVVSLNTTWSSDKIDSSIYAAATGSLNPTVEAYDVFANTPNLEAPTAGTVKKGDIYHATTAGDFFTEAMAIGDTLIAKIDDPAALADWVVLEGNNSYSFADVRLANLVADLTATEQNTIKDKLGITDAAATTPKEHEINGVSLEANITGNFNFDWNAYSQFILTPTGAVTLSNANQPVHPNTKVISGRFKASSHAVTFPANWIAREGNDSLSATKDTFFEAETMPDGNVSYTLDNTSGSTAAGATLTGTALNLSNIAGNNYNYATPSTATSYTTTSPVINGFARCFINAATEPTVTGATKVSGSTFTANTVMEMVVESPNGTAVEYYFIKR